MPGPGQNIAAIQAAWTTAKAQLAQIQTDAATLANDLTALEATCDTLYGYGAGDVVDWLRTQSRQTRFGYQPRISAGGNIAPSLVEVQAPQPGTRDTTTVDLRPISVTPTGQLCNLS
jgi:hypothetical protein